MYTILRIIRSSSKFTFIGITTTEIEGNVDYIKIIEIVGGFVGKLLGLQKERKLEVATYLESIADTLSAFGPRLRAGATTDELAGLAQQAHEHAVRFRDVTKDVLKESDLDSFTMFLADAHNAKVALTSEQPADRDERLRRIAEVAGSLRVAAVALRGAASQVPAGH